MALRDTFKKLFQGSNNNQYSYAKMLNGSIPVFSQFGQNIYASDVVQICIDKTATEISKLQPKHIRTDKNGMQSIPNSSLNRLFKFGPNELMTTRDFLEKVVWLLLLNYNAFIFPKYEARQEEGGWTREYKAFYPLNPTQVTFLQDLSNALFVEMRFANGEKFTIPYSEIIHIRKKFSLSDVMGGGLNGQPDNTALLKVLQINDVVLQGLEKAIKTSLSVRGIVKINTMLDGDKQEAERKRLEEAIDAGTTGIVALDLKGDYVNLNPDPKLIDKSTLEFLQSKVLSWFNMPLPIFTGDFNDEQKQAWYDGALEVILIGLGQAFTKCVFSQMELAHGNEIICYHHDLMYLSTKAKMELIKVGGDQGLFTINQKLAFLGLAPIPDGDMRTMSLNHIDVNLVSEYQLSKAKSGSKGSE